MKLHEDYEVNCLHVSGVIYTPPFSLGSSLESKNYTNYYYIKGFFTAKVDIFFMEKFLDFFPVKLRKIISDGIKTIVVSDLNKYNSLVYDRLTNKNYTEDVFGITCLDEVSTVLPKRNGGVLYGSFLYDKILGVDTLDSLPKCIEYNLKKDLKTYSEYFKTSLVISTSLAFKG